ncbi:MAG: PIG-L family deacetylase [Chloroflexi bacterium]|nr:PIG-L family deacetylase [Chloroflexota bacterium]
MARACDIMVITAHPDDAEYGIAGSVAKWVREGKSVMYVVCTNGDKGSSDPEMTSPRLAFIREKEQRAAAKVLGVRRVAFLRHPDQSLEDTPEFRKEIVSVMRKYRPGTVAAPDPYRRYIWHHDHRVLGQVVLDAVYPYVRDRLAYPDLLDAGLKPHIVKEVLFWGAEDPNYRSDITDTFDIKLRALRCHKSQVSGRPDHEEWLLQRARMLAEGTGFKLAEAFHREELE